MRTDSGVLWDELVDVDQWEADEQEVEFVPSMDGDVTVIDVVGRRVR